MQLTTEQLEHLERAARLAADAETEWRDARINGISTSTMNIGSALSAAKDLLQSLLRENQPR
jgi:hypothetical protein